MFLPGCARFPEFVQNFSEKNFREFVEFVLSRFSHFYIAIDYSNPTFCGALTPSFCEFTWKLSKFQQNEHTPDLLFWIFKLCHRNP